VTHPLNKFDTSRPNAELDLESSFLIGRLISNLHCTEVRFATLLSGEFATSIAAINPPEKKLAKRNSVHCKNSI